MAGAYRCPVCGIDFPTGTPGTPEAPMSPAAVEPDRGSAPSEKPSAAELAARLKGALDRELAIGEEDDDAFADRQEATDQGDDLREASGADRGAPLPELRRERGEAAGAADLTLAPARERPGPPARAERRRERAPVAREPRLRRSKAGTLTTTIVVALLLIGVAGGSAVWLDLSGTADLGIVRERLPAALRPAAADLSVSAADGWVSVPAGAAPVAVTADGPFRVRIDGLVYSVDAGRTLRIPREETTRVQVRAVGEGTVARVSEAR